MFEGLRKWTCGHPELTPEDGEGRAICVRCGSSVVVRPTKVIFDAQMEALKKQHGW